MSGAPRAAGRRAWLRRVVLWSVVVGGGGARAELSDTVARVKPAVLLVGTFRATDNPRFRLRGTGFAVAAGNHAITNAHVLPDPSESQDGMALAVQVRMPGQGWSQRSATVLEADRVHDLALLRFDGPPVQALSLRDSATVREGQSVAFIGFPIGGILGFSPVTHRGIVSSITPAVLPAPTSRQLSEASIRGIRAGSFDIFQLDATAYPGNSGGPLFDPDSGEVVGVVNMVLLKNTREGALSQPSGISYAVPSNFIRPLLERAGLR